MKVLNKKIIFTIVSISMMLALYSPIFSNTAKKVQGSNASSIIVWANDGGDKVTQDELRAYGDSTSVINSVWDGTEISIFGAKK